MQYPQNLKAVLLFGLFTSQVYAAEDTLSDSSTTITSTTITQSIPVSDDITTNASDEATPTLSASGEPILKEINVTTPAEVNYEEIQSEIRALAEKSKDYVTPESVRESARAMSAKLQKKIDERKIEVKTSLRLEDFTSAMPIDITNITSNYGYRNFAGRGEFHPGIDFAAPTGTPIYCTAPGTVVYAGWKNGYGNFIEVDHGNGMRTRYGHASALFVSVGDRVTKRQRIAAVGSTGRSTGPHLHFEVYQNGVRQNPSTYLAMLSPNKR